MAMRAFSGARGLEFLFLGTMRCTAAGSLVAAPAADCYNDHIVRLRCHM